MRRMLIGLIMACLLLVSAGCVKTTQEIVVDTNGNALVTFRAIGDKIMAGDELTQLAWQLQQMIPQLNTHYTRTVYSFTESYNDYLVYEWKAVNPVPVTDILGVTWVKNNDSYEFRLKMEPVFTEITESNRNDVVMEITLVMPKPVEIANSIFVDNNTVRWVLTKEQLSKQITLKAYTE